AGGRKIAGIAQAMRRGFAMVSGMLIVSQDPVYVTDLRNEFYAAAGGTPDLVPDHGVTLSDLVGRRIGLDEVEDALKAGFAEVHPYVPALPTEAEVGRARRLAAERRLAEHRRRPRREKGGTGRGDADAAQAAREKRACAGGNCPERRSLAMALPREDALKYPSQGRPGTNETPVTKPTSTQQDMQPVYSQTDPC